MPSRKRSSRTWTHIDPKAGPIRRARARWLAPALAAVLGALLGSSACSSSSTPNPPMIGSCTEKNGVPCTTGAVGGGPAPEGDGGPAEDATSTVLGDASSCTGATQIFGTAPAACIACIATSCCLNPTSCPNDTSCAPRRPLRLELSSDGPFVRAGMRSASFAGHHHGVQRPRVVLGEHLPELPDAPDGERGSVERPRGGLAMQRGRQGDDERRPCASSSSAATTRPGSRRLKQAAIASLARLTYEGLVSWRLGRASESRTAAGDRSEARRP
jgi:hypothetical protein